MIAITIYCDKKHELAHIITSEVNNDNGAHKVVDSQVQSLFDIKTLIAWYKNKYGDANVRAFQVEEIE
jgi:hypothetical protein